jgi:hypothetical protein
MKFRKKPVVIDAFIFGLHENPKWFNEAVKAGVVEYEWCGSSKDLDPCDGLKIKTLEGEMRTSYGYEYIIKGVKGEIYPCKPDIFEATYEEVEE